jgi:ribonuclease P/MRP protein subunit RPP40
VSGATSSLLEILFGVPQGSIMDPLLFLIYINDLPLATDLQAYLYADDTSLFYKADSIEALFNDTNEKLKSTETWFLANCLTLHPSKTRVMLFSHSTPDSNLHITLMGEPILRVHEKGSECSFKLVGVQLDECLNWKHHINHVKRKVAVAISLISRAKHFLPTSIRLLLYKALVLCHFSYCNSIWGGASAATLKPLVNLQKKAIRVAIGTHYNAHTDPICARTNSLCMEDMYTISIPKLAGSLINGYAPPGILPVFKFNSPMKISETVNVPLFMSHSAGLTQL